MQIARRRFLQGATGLLWLTASGCRAVAASHDGLTRIDELGAALVRSGRSAGYAVGVARGGNLLHARGYGFADLEQLTPVTAQTVFRIGSITKQFTAALIVRLAEQSKLSLDDELAEHLPDFPRAADVTIEQLLTHTAGIHNYTDRPSFQADARLAYTSATLIEHIASYSPLYDFEPGTAFAYSNSGYALLGVIAERVSGLSLAALFQREIFDRIGLKHTALDDDCAVVAHRAAGYEARADSPGRFRKAQYISMSYAAGAGALRSTVSDLATWHHALITGKVVGADGLRRMLTPARLKNGALASTALHRPRPSNEPGSAPRDYGYGLYLARHDGRRRIYHGGSMSGVKAHVETLPEEGITIVQLSNTTDGLKSGASLELAAFIR